MFDVFSSLFTSQMTLVGSFNWSGLVRVDLQMAQLMVGIYLAITSVVCVNIYIALLSDTFTRIYAQAQANSAILRAQVILSIEGGLSKKAKLKYHHYIQTECSPLVSIYSQ